MTNNRKPEWLKIRPGGGKEYVQVKEIVRRHQLHTICESGNCPNKSECWGRGVATFMILGNICTRSCKFCNVATGKPLPPDPGEPQRVAQSIALMKLKSVVITSVDRDDLPDYGATFWANTIKTIRKLTPLVKIEVLIPDFQGKLNLLDKVIEAKPDIISHNLETVRRLTPMVRSRAQYDISLSVINHVCKSGIVSKSGIMVGLGETSDEVIETMNDLIQVGCQIFTIGQYLQPLKNNIAVAEYVHPNVFLYYKQEGLKMGFRHVESAPLVRSSYYAENHLH